MENVVEKEKVVKHDFISRQQKRQQERDQEKYNEAMRKQMSAAATKGDLMMLVQSFQKLRDRLFQLDIINSALEKIMISKGIATRDEIKEAVNHEANRAVKMKEVNEEKVNYEKRLDACKDWDIDITYTNIPTQILDDNSLTIESKIELAEKYNIQTILDKLKLKEEESKEVTEQKEKIVKLLDEIKPEEEN